MSLTCRLDCLFVVREGGAVAMTGVPRRTQAQRRASTQARLLDATVASLAELGWARTTTTEVVRRAGVSRGAQVHHFPTKAELVVAAIDRVFARRLAEFRAAFAELGPDDRTSEAAIDLLVRLFQGSTFAAWLEVVVAARTDPELRAALEPVGERFQDGVDELFAELFPGADPVAAHFAFAVLEGVALERVACPDPARSDRVIELFKTFARLLGETQG